MIVGILIGGALVYITYKLSNSKKFNSMEYRKLLTNLYVAGKVREAATKDNIDLTKEYVEFNKLFQKKGHIKDIDNVIEEQLNQKIQKGLDTKK